MDTALGDNENPIVDVPHTDVERQSIGNCWIYSMATWVESMHLSATGEKYDISQSYWTYWHWYDEVTGGLFGDEIETGGQQYVSNGLALSRGVVAEKDFIPEDTQNEMSSRQSSALSFLNNELKNGRLKASADRRNAKLVREILDEAWRLPEASKTFLTKAFGADGRGTLNATGTPIVTARTFAVKYTKRTGSAVAPVTSTLDKAISEWRDASYPTRAADRRTFLVRVQRALHDRQPVVITWNVDFNAMESSGDRRGSFNKITLDGAGPGRQGGHMTVMEDYQATLANGEVLKAGVTLDPSKPEDKAKLDAALSTTAKIDFIRIKNSWGAVRDDRASAPGFPGYHDLYMDYMNGPIKWCSTGQTGAQCTGSSVPFRKVMLPPGY